MRYTNKDRSGKISISEFKDIFDRNEALFDCDWHQMVKEVDINGDGEVI